MIKEPKPNWTWYDYKMECVRVLINHDLTLEVDKEQKLINVFAPTGKLLFACRRMAWKVFFRDKLQRVLEINY